MENNRVKNATRNMIFAWLQNLYTQIVPFVIRTVMIYTMGVKYLGLNSLFASIVSVLNMAEMGVGGAMVYSMYKPVAENDKDRICKLMNQYRLYYRIIGCAVGAMGICVMPFLNNLIKSDIPEGINIYILYLLNLGTTVLTYWLFAYKNCLLTAYQRTDVTSKISMMICTTQYIVQIGVLVLFRNYYLYLVVALFMGIAANCVTALAVSKMFPGLTAKGRLPHSEVKDINRRIKDLFTNKIGSVVINQVDAIVISAYLGLSVLAIYQNYYCLMIAVSGLMKSAFSSCTSSIGNSIVLESKEKNLKDLKTITLIITWFTGFCSCCFLCLFQPFMKVWVGENLMLDYGVVICIVIYFFALQITRIFDLYRDAGGTWHKDRFRPLIAAFVNLGLTLITVNFYGLYGVVLSTVVAIGIIGLPWQLHSLFADLFTIKDLYPFIRSMVYYVIISIIAGVVSAIVCSFINISDWADLFIKAVICCILPNAIFFFAYFKREEFIEAVMLIDAITKNKLRISEKLRRLYV